MYLSDLRWIGDSIRKWIYVFVGTVLDIPFVRWIKRIGLETVVK